MNEEMINRAQREVDARRQRALVSADERREAARAAVPQLRELEMAQSSAGIRAASLAASGAPEEQTRAALAEMHALRQQICDALLAVGIRPESLEPQFVCPRCRDTGRVGGKQCECVSQLIRTYRREEITRRAPLALCSFDSFDVSLYPDRFVAELGMTVREHMTSIFEYCKAYADHFSRNAPSLYLCGYAGLGKTHLALSIADKVLEQGYDVLYVSAQDAFARVEKERFGEGGGTMDAMLAADLLILDDLGTEYISPYVSACLYDLINTRQLRSRPTVYTSNIMTDAELRRRYTEKIVSRLLGSCELLTFCGDDLRLRNK